MSRLGKFFERALGKAAPGEAPAGMGIGLVLGLDREMPIAPRRNLKALGVEGFGQNVTVFACVSLIARAIAGVPWLLYQRKGTRLVEVEDHAILRLLQRPNPWQSGVEFTEALAAHTLVTGNSFAYGVAPENSRQPRELWLLPPAEMKIVPGERQPVDAYIFRQGMPGELALSPAEVLHHKMLALPGEAFGLSPIAVAAAAVDSDNEGQAWNLRLLSNSARPPGALKVDGPLSKEQRERLRQEIERKFSGGLNAGKPLLLEGGLSWQAFGLSPAELDWLAGLKLSHALIARSFGVPPELIGDSEHKTYASFTEARASFYQETVLPHLVRLRDGLNRWLVPKFGEGLALDFDRDSIEALQEDRGKLWARVREADWLTVNEKRRATGYEDLGPEADVVLVSSAMMPLGGEPTIGEGAARAVAGARPALRRKSVDAVPFLQAASGVEFGRGGK